eukprot:TRINITY_DN234_c0_g1_i14.p1 TRINITY_DN234_c0_g1~~TRINITY_DN234_c0_g1_i14.p1  ORF type:complete len:307 (+),score=104.11 TRINITY_DN234_c0_g1_i14:530-1450(+)
MGPYEPNKTVSSAEKNLEEIETQHIAKKRKLGEMQGEDSEDSDSIAADDHRIETMHVKDNNMLNTSVRSNYQAPTGDSDSDGEGEDEEEEGTMNESFAFSQEDSGDGVREFDTTSGEREEESGNSRAAGRTRRSRRAKVNPADHVLNARDMKARRSAKKKTRMLQRTVKDFDAPGTGSGPGSSSKKKKKKGSEGPLSNNMIPKVKYSDLGGMEDVLQEVRELIEYPLTHPEIYTHLGVEPARGILLHGPPGCGKTMLANAIAGELGVTFLKIAAPEVVSGMSGESEKKLRDLFQDAREQAPCLVCP